MVPMVFPCSDLIRFDSTRFFFIQNTYSTAINTTNDAIAVLLVSAQKKKQTTGEISTVKQLIVSID